MLDRHTSKRSLMWNPNASDVEIIASLKDLIEAMAEETGSSLKWRGTGALSTLDAEKAKAKKRKAKGRKGQRAEASALHIVCHCGEALHDARVLQTETAMRLGRLVTTVDRSDDDAADDTLSAAEPRLRRPDPSVHCVPRAPLTSPPTVRAARVCLLAGPRSISTPKLWRCC